MRVACVLQARMASRRLPGKALADLAGAPLLARVIQRLQRVSLTGPIVLATTRRPEDDALAALAERLGVRCHRGDVDDVLRRIAEALEGLAADYVVHATGDNPCVDPGLVDRLVAFALAGGYDFACSTGLPIGAGADVYAAGTIAALDRLAAGASYREHINAFLFDNPGLFRVGTMPADPGLDLPALRLTVDTPEDLAVCRSVYDRLHGDGRLFALRDVVDLHRSEPALFLPNSATAQRYVSERASRVRRGGAGDGDRAR